MIKANSLSVYVQRGAAPNLCTVINSVALYNATERKTKNLLDRHNGNKANDRWVHSNFVTSLPNRKSHFMESIHVDIFIRPT